MKNKLLRLYIGGLVFCASVIFVCQGVAAQTTSEQKQKNEAALLIVRSQPVSSAFYDNLKSKAPSDSATFNLTRAFFNEQSSDEKAIRTADFEKWHMMDFEDGKNRTRISIIEYKSAELAAKYFNNLGYSYGSVTYSKEIGDETRKGFSVSGEFLGLGFRKDKFTVHISSKSEATTKSFAESALKAIEAK
jgi:hypothetical protein